MEQSLLTQPSTDILSGSRMSSGPGVDSFLTGDGVG